MLQVNYTDGTPRLEAYDLETNYLVGRKVFTSIGSNYFSVKFTPSVNLLYTWPYKIYFKIVDNASNELLAKTDCIALQKCVDITLPHTTTTTSSTTTTTTTAAPTTTTTSAPTTTTTAAPTTTTTTTAAPTTTTTTTLAPSITVQAQSSSDWEWYFDFNDGGGSDENFDLIGPDSGSLTLSPLHGGSVSTYASKITPSGLASGPVTVTFKKNSITVNTQSFSLGDDVSNVVHTFTGLVSGDVLKIEVTEVTPPEAELVLSYSTGTWTMFLDTAVDDSITATEVSVNGNSATNCSTSTESDSYVPGLTIGSGGTFVSHAGTTPLSCSVLRYQQGTSCKINGITRNNGDSFMIGSYLVTLVINHQNCDIYAC